MELELVSLIVEHYGRAIDFFVGALGFELVEDSPSVTNDGRPKRWVVVRPPGARTGLLLAQADGDAQAAAVGQQFAGRVGFFLRVADFDAALERMQAAGVVFVTEPRTEAYGRVAVFLDISGNRWDLLGPADRQASVHLGVTSSERSRAEPPGGCVHESGQALSSPAVERIIASPKPGRRCHQDRAWPKSARRSG